MSQTLRQGSSSSQDISNQLQAKMLRSAIDWALNDRMFAKIKLHGNVSWSPRCLVVSAVLMAWSQSCQLTQAFTSAAKLSNVLYGKSALATYQGTMRALSTYGGQLLPCIWDRLELLMHREAASYFRVGIWAALAVDGTRISTPRSRSNEKAFAAKKYGKGKMAKSRKKWKNKKKRSKKLSTPVCQFAG